jgi:serine/threonine protein kinase
VGRAPFDLRPGDQVAGYTIERAVGRGGSASVYRATHPRLAEPVAFKIMHEHDPSGVGRPRFAREAALLKKLDHPHVVEMIDYGFTESELPYIVFELLRGRSLYAAIKRLGPFDPVRVGRIALQMLDALGAAHALGIVHRDIKPGNVYLCAGHDEDFAKLLDLGLAKALEGEGPETDTITGTGYRLGTPRYMSPEMARGQKVGAAGDLYAMGLVMAEMLAGEPVVKGNVQVDVLMAHGNTKALPLDDVIERSAFAAVIRRALAKELDVRYRTALQMRVDVETALAMHQRVHQVTRMVGDPAVGLGEGATADLVPTFSLDDPGTLDMSPSQTDELPPDERGESEEEPPTTERMPQRVAAPPSLAPSQPPSAPLPVGFSSPPSAGEPARPPSRGRLVGIVLVGVALVVLVAILGWIGSH